MLWIISISIQLNHKHSTQFVNINILQTSAFRFYRTTHLQCSSAKTTSTSSHQNGSSKEITTHLEPFKQSLVGPSLVQIKQSSSHFTFRATIINASAISDNQLYEFLASFWKTENYVTSPEITISKEERHALSRLQRTTTFEDGRYEAGLLLHPNASLQENFTAAIQQFKKMKYRLSQQPDLHTMYQDTIDKDTEKEYIRKLESHEIPTTRWILHEHGCL